MDQENKIRLASLADGPAISALFEAHLKEQAGFDDLSQVHPEFSAGKLLSLWLSSGNHKFFLAEAQGRVVGFIRLNINSGGQLLRVEPAKNDSLAQKLAPRRVLRKIFSFLLNAVSEPFETPPVFAPLRTGLIADLFILAEFRRQGLGSKLLAAALEWFSRNSLSEVLLQANTVNTPGINFWTRHGFTAFRQAMKKKL
jgi:GNAT superfamily N-acetyltransferase